PAALHTQSPHSRRGLGAPLWAQPTGTELPSEVRARCGFFRRSRATGFRFASGAMTLSSISTPVPPAASARLHERPVSEEPRPAAFRNSRLQGANPDTARAARTLS